MRLSLDDGYTLPFTTLSEVVEPITKTVTIKGLPVVTGKYRPALPTAIAEWRRNLARADSGLSEVSAHADHVAAHLVEWDVEVGGKSAPIKADFVRLVPEALLIQLVNAVNTWGPKELAVVAGN